MSLVLSWKLKIQAMVNYQACVHVVADEKVRCRNTNKYMVFNEIVVCVPYLVSEGLTGSQSRGPRRLK